MVTSVKTPVKIRIDSTTRDELRALKKGGDTFDDVVRRLMTEAKWKEGIIEVATSHDLRDIEKEEG